VGLDKFIEFQSPDPRLAATTNAPSSERTKEPREQSTIAFPYAALEDALAVSRMILQKGAVPVTRDQLAAALGHAASSGAFAVKSHAARMFGLVETVAGKYQLTQLGFEILDADEMRVKGAKARAFLNVPLYNRVYDEFRGKQLPPRPRGLEQAFVGLGVAPKRKSNARWAFDRSARQAGFFSHGEDRLVAPVIGPTQTIPQTEQKPTADEQRNAPDGAGDVIRSAPTRHPFLDGLFQSLPDPGSEWDVVGQAHWLEAAAKIFRLMYRTNGDVEVKAKPDQE
jgi:hypothetical protein